MNKKHIAKLGAITSMIALSTTYASAIAYSPAASAATTSSRVAGADRYATSAKISQQSFPNGASVVYVARGDILFDALSGGTLTDGPVLLTPAMGTPVSSIVNEINRLNPSKVIALGGESAVSDAMLQELGNGRQTDRLSGQDRFGTASQISLHAFPNGSTKAYATNAYNMADAVSGGSLTGGPLLPVPATGTAPQTITSELHRLSPGNVTALGGTGVLSDSMLANLKTAAGANTTTRLSGQHRYSTSAAVAKAAFPNGTDTVYLANGKVFADAVSGGSLANGPILLVNDGADLSASLQLVKDWKPTKVVALGGSDVVSNNVLNQFVNAANGTITTTPPATSVPAGWSADEYKVLQLTNAERAKVGLSALKPETCLHTIARNWSNDMASRGVMEHGDFGARLKTCFSNSFAGENVARGYSTPQEVVTGWMNSPGHKANILDPNYEYLGVGKSSTGNFWTQDFSSSSS